MDVTVYLPDKIGIKAKKAGINLSGTLRSALEAELGRRKRMRAARNEMGDPQVFEVRVVNNDAEYTGRITGWIIDRNSDWEVYLTDDERVILYNEFRGSFEAMTEDQARSELEADRFPEALRLLGVEPVVDL